MNRLIYSEQVSSSAYVGGRLRDIADPSVGVVVLGGGGDLEVLDLQVGHIIHRDFEVHADGAHFFPALSSCWVLQGYFHNDGVLQTPLELLYRPLRQLLLLLVLSHLTLDSLGDLESYICGLSWYWEFADDLCSEVVRREVGSDFEGELEFVLRELIDEGVDSEGCGVVPVYTIVHDQELSIRRVNRQRLHRLEVPYIHTLVEVAIIQHHSPKALYHILSTHDQVVIEHQSQFWVSLQVTLHLDHSIN